MAKMTEEVREKFLAATRLGILTTLARDGAPISMPVWFDWDGRAVRVFTGTDSAKVKRIRRDARISVLIVNHLDEKEAWVAFDGSAIIRQDGAVDLLERLAEKYWDMTDPGHQTTVASWKNEAESLCVIELVPAQIRSQLG